MKPQRSQRNPLCSPKEFTLRWMTGEIISCTVEFYFPTQNIRSTGPDLFAALYKRMGLLINFHGVRLNEAMRLVI